MRKQSRKTLAVVGRVRLERVNNSPFVTARVFHAGKLHSKSTGIKWTDLNTAKEVAAAWYVELLAKPIVKPAPALPLFADAVDAFLKHCDALKTPSEGQRRNYRDKWAMFQKMPEFAGLALDSITLEWLEDIRTKRSKAVNKRGEPVSNNTLKKDFDFLRLVIRHSITRMKVLKELPAFPTFEGRQWKVEKNPRPFFTYPEWVMLRDRAKRRMNEDGLNPRTKRQRSELYAFILVCIGGALRPEEASSLLWKHCTEAVVEDDDQTPCINIKVYGKHAQTRRGREDGSLVYDGYVGYHLLKAMKPDAAPDDRLFSLDDYSEGFESLMKGDGDDVNLREVTLPDGRIATRSLRSLRSTAISMRLDMGPNVTYRAAGKWARTHPTHIEHFYDQTHLGKVMAEVTGFKKPVKAAKNLKEAKRAKASAAALKKAQKALKDIPKPSGDELW